MVMTERRELTCTKITLAQNVWDTFEPTTIETPEHWHTQLHDMQGDHMPALSWEDIREKINHPYGMPPLAELAKTAQKIGIVFDDMARATPCREIAHIVLDELFRGGARKEQIVFICALGNHGAHTREDFVQKLGEDIVEEYPVFNHNPFDKTCLVCVGKSSCGNDVYFNREMYSCDLKIGIGGITPHLDNAFGGGYKILFPGLAGFDTTMGNHEIGRRYRRENNLGVVQAMGDLSNTGMRADVESMGRLIPNFFKIDVIYNSRLEILEVTAGDPIEEYYEGAKFAQRSYATKRVSNKDIVIANINAKSAEPFLGVHMGILGLKKSGGTLIVINFSKRGLIPHYIIGQFGTEYGGPGYGGEAIRDSAVKKVIYYSPYSDCALKNMCQPAPGVWVHCRTWDEVLKETASYGEDTEAAVLTDATIQYFVD